MSIFVRPMFWEGRFLEYYVLFTIGEREGLPGWIRTLTLWEAERIFILAHMYIYIERERKRIYIYI